MTVLLDTLKRQDNQIRIVRTKMNDFFDTLHTQDDIEYVVLSLESCVGITLLEMSEIDEKRQGIRFYTGFPAT